MAVTDSAWVGRELPGQLIIPNYKLMFPYLHFSESVPSKALKATANYDFEKSNMNLNIGITPTTFYTSNISSTYYKVCISRLARKLCIIISESKTMF